MQRKFTKKIALCALYSTFALLSFMLESLIPPLIIPNARIGISNIFILLSTFSLGLYYGITTILVKSILGSLFIGNVSAVLYSLPAGVIALVVQVLILSFNSKVSITATSIIGSIINSLVQNVVFCVFTNSFEYLIYLPYLAVISLISGLIVGTIIYILLKKIPKIYLGA